MIVYWTQEQPFAHNDLSNNWSWQEDEGGPAYGGNNHDDNSDDDNPDHQRGAWVKVSLFGRNIRAAMGSGTIYHWFSS